MTTAFATVADVRGIAPEFGEVGEVDPPVTDAVIATWVRVTQAMIGQSRWLELTTDGHALLAAHYVEQDPEGGGGASGPIGSASVGPVSVSYASTPPSDDLLASTHYGRAYLALRQVVLSTGTGIVSNTAIRLG